MLLKSDSHIENFNNLPDKSLVDLYTETGNKNIISVLFNRYIHLVYGVCLKYLHDDELSKDLSMQVFEELIGKLKGQDITHFKNWLYTVTKNSCLMYLRKLKKDVVTREVLQLEDQDNFVENDIILHHHNETDINIELLDKALEKLKPGQQKCVRLMYLENRSYKEIAGITGYSEKKVKSYIQNGKRNLKNIIYELNGKKEQT